MKTTILKKEEKGESKWYLIDAKDQILGRLSTIIANKLRGKDKPTFSANLDCGDFVIIINAEKVKLTGNKREDKMYYRHTGYPGHIKSANADKLLNEKPAKVIELAVYGMLPKNKLRKEFMRKLKIYAGESHPHEAQKPEKLEITY